LLAPVTRTDFSAKSCSPLFVIFAARCFRHGVIEAGFSWRINDAS
jgi:hypothetical protein